MPLLKSISRWQWLLIGGNRIRFDTIGTDPYGPVPIKAEPGSGLTMRIDGADVRLTDTPTVQMGSAVFPLDPKRAIKVPQGSWFSVDEAQVKVYMVDKKDIPYEGGVVKCIIDAPQCVKIDDSVVV